MTFFNTDIPELSGSDTAVCLENLEWLGLRQSRVTESMLAALSELANAIIHDAGGDPDTVTSILLSLQGAPDAVESPIPDAVARMASPRMIAPINRDTVARLSLYTDVQMRLILYHLISERMPPVDDRPAPIASVAEAARGRIAYMAGAFADKAYERLSPLVPRARAATFHSFVDACEEVRGGLCEYGILPLENSQSGKLTAFSHLILRYGLYVVAVCDLENGVAPGQFTRFALLCRASEEGAPASLTRPLLGFASPRFMDLLHVTASPAPVELLTAAAFCGLTPVRMDTLPRFEELDMLRKDTAEDGILPLSFVFALPEDGRGDIATFLRYLALEASDDQLTGAYCIV